MSGGIDSIHPMADCLMRLFLTLKSSGGRSLAGGAATEMPEQAAVDAIAAVVANILRRDSFIIFSKANHTINTRICGIIADDEKSFSRHGSLLGVVLVRRACQ